MTYFKFFLFVWVGFATIKSVIVFATSIDIAFFTYKENKRIYSFVGAIVSSSISSIGILITWPLMLYYQKIDFFKFPDKEYVKRLAEAFEKNEE